MEQGDAARGRARGRRAILAGTIHPEQPLHDGGRWGISVVFRSAHPVMQVLADLGREADALAGSGHWAHGPDDIHFTIRALEPHRSCVPRDDPRLRTYIRALDEAAEGLPALRMVVRGVSPHPGGIAVVGYPRDDTADELRRRLRTILERYAVPPIETSIRTSWYAHLVHFAAPVPDTTAVVAWCDARKNLELGELEFGAAELISWHQPDPAGGVRGSYLHRAALAGGGHDSLLHRAARNTQP
ncbi:hypothetical protein ABN034_21775 [Actinopolymorpha sp. B11F2]|uniref:hypothetical protein n=1 Tax=Actinopolymorpha sp. B11F2 TaxID=3160862 RepID=UPI0032E4AF36